ncbi:MAG: winged helix-turn-helix transcriptional regulator [Chthoniobacterales bacterium]|nr:winged helix-turn-helix transcriptional regulator [Chthoniobacterales bacterium]
MTRIDPRQLNRMASLFATLSDPARLRILHSLRTGPRSVGEIHRACRLKQANTSKHLRILREAGLVTARREGTSVRYAICEPLIFDLCDLACGDSHGTTKTATRPAR